MINQILSCYIGIGVIYMAWCFLRKRDEKFMDEARSQWRDIKIMLVDIPDNIKPLVGIILAITTTAYLAWCVLTWPLSVARKGIKKWHP